MERLSSSDSWNKLIADGLKGVTGQIKNALVFYHQVRGTGMLISQVPFRYVHSPWNFDESLIPKISAPVNELPPRFAA